MNDELRSQWVAAGAAFGDYAGAEVPMDFGDVAAEVRAARGDVALFACLHRATIRATGEDRADFLHNLTSNDVRSLAPGEGCRAALLTVQSKVVADVEVRVGPDAIELDLDEAVRAAATEHLERHLVAEDVELVDLGESQVVLALVGPRVEALLGATTADTLPQALGASARLKIGEIDAVVARVLRSQTPCFELHVASADAARLWTQLCEAGARPAGAAALESLRVDAGLARAGADFDDSTLALEAGLTHAIHFQKGCYLGQEIVERQSARGKVKRQLLRLELAAGALPESGVELGADGAVVGTVTSAAPRYVDDSVALLARVRSEHCEIGAELEVDPSGERRVARVVAVCGPPD